MTKVLFRKWNNGQIIALLPDIPWNNNSYMTTSYMHVGKHGPADYTEVINKTVPARKHEYQELWDELLSLGYNNLCIRQQARPAFR